MENLSHTLVGAALGQAGLKKRTGLGMATLMIGANFPDLDVLAIPLGENLTFRRGWTHGPVALVVLPLVLTLCIIGWDRLQARRNTRPPDRAPVRPPQVLLLATISILTHPFLDWLNTYGIRLLMPFSQDWFYGDTLFIADPWLWIILGLGVFLGRRWVSVRPARVALGLAGVYIGLMVAGSRVASRLAAQEAEARGLEPVRRLMAGPVPLNPLRRELVYDHGDAYTVGALAWTPAPRITLAPGRVPRNQDHPLVREAMRQESLQDFMYWARFPFFAVERAPWGFRVHAGDARYSHEARGSRLGTSVVVPRSGR